MARKRDTTPKPARSKKTAALLPEGYAELLSQLKERIRAAQLRAGLAVNREMVLLYWQIGRDILERQEREGWGAKVIDRLASDLHRAFPDMTGLSPRNLKYMRAFAAAWPDEAIVQGPACTNHLVSTTSPCSRSSAPSRNASGMPMPPSNTAGAAPSSCTGSRATSTRGRARPPPISSRASPRPESDLAREMLKDPYKLEFLSLAEDAEERTLQKGLLEHIHQFLIELGAGFAFVGQQYRLEVGGEEFYIDLLFYHLKLRCYIVIDLKMTPFKPEYAGKMNFYLSAVDDLLRHPDDKPSIGLILCKAKNQVVAEYALRDLAKPVGVSTYITKLVESLPPALCGSLPSPQELEAELKKDDDAED